MTVDRIYRQDGLTIAQLAERLGMPEYRLRRLINQALGYRNFNSFLNVYRIADAKAALADPAQAEVPVLTIALDAGFSSLGPFNRAFKAETGMTPSEFRRVQGGMGSPIPNSASISSNSARRISPAA
jgi:AraC-like DNA-binding protein